MKRETTELMDQTRPQLGREQTKPTPQGRKELFVTEKLKSL